MTIEQIIPYLLPPLLGAFIGYVTNYIAIRMLFRPLRAWHVFGVRLPLTPGIIPSKRGELAAKIGDMVGTHLFTSDDVGLALEKDAFRRELKGAVKDKLDSFLGKDLGPLESLVPQEHRNRFRNLVEMLRWKALKAITNYLASEDFENRLRPFLQEKAEDFLARDLESFLTPERYENLRRHLDDKIGDLLQSEKVVEAAGSYVDSKTDEWLRSNRPLRQVLPEDLVEILLTQLEKEIPGLMDKFSSMLYDPDFRDRLARKGKESLEKLLDSLEGLTAIISAFVDLDTIYDRIPEFLDKAAEEIASWLKEEKSHKQVSAMLRERLDGLLEHSIADLTDKMPYEKVKGIRNFARKKAIETVRSKRTKDSILSLSEQAIDRLKDQPFQTLLQKSLPEGGVDRALQLTSDRLLLVIRSTQARDALDSILAEWAEQWLFNRPLGRLSSQIPADLEQELEEGIYKQLAEVLKKEVPPLIETLNVRGMVEDKVNALDILQVEELLMGIMKEQFKYINIFGALLGALIGLVNLIALRIL